MPKAGLCTSRDLPPRIAPHDVAHLPKGDECASGKPEEDGRRCWQWVSDAWNNVEGFLDPAGLSFLGGYPPEKTDMLSN